MRNVPAWSDDIRSPAQCELSLAWHSHFYPGLPGLTGGLHLHLALILDKTKQTLKQRHRRDNEWMYTIVIIHNSLIKSSSDSELPVMNPIRVMCGLGLISSSELLLFPLVAALLWSLIETRRSQEGAITPVTPSTISSQAAQCTTHRTDLISGLWSCPTLII